MRRTLVFVLFAASSRACGSFSDASGPSDGADAGSGGTDAGSGVDAVAADAAPDASAVECVITGPGTAQSWTTVDDADFPTPGTARLNQEATHRKGLVVAPGRHTVGRLHVAFDFAVDEITPYTPGDGLALVWSTDPQMDAGRDGADFGACGLAEGFGVFFADDGATIQLRNLQSCAVGSYVTVSSFTDGVFRHVEIDMDEDGKVKVFYDGASTAALTGILPGWKPLENAWIGFSGATGGYAALHRVRNATLTLLDEPKCP